MNDAEKKQSLALNPFGDESSSRGNGGALAQAETERAIAEVKGAILLAKHFPRDEKLAMDKILNAFTRPTLAEKALYNYARGGTDITGPSIRAAEAIAQAWQNFQCGVRELEQRNGESIVEAFAWDVENNTRDVKVFTVPHVRDTRQGKKLLTDSRDIYEMVANQGARRKRACILALIPGDVVEAAINQAETTLAAKVQITPELIQRLLAEFANYGVSRAAIEARIQRRMEAITPGAVLLLGKIRNSIKDGMSSAADQFDLTLTDEKKDEAPSESRTSKVADALGKRAAQTGATPKVDPPKPAGGPINTSPMVCPACGAEPNTAHSQGCDLGGEVIA